MSQLETVEALLSTVEDSEQLDTIEDEVVEDSEQLLDTEVEAETDEPVEDSEQLLDTEVEAETDEPVEYTINTLSEAIGLEASELYGVKVAMSDGTESTIGQLKDNYSTVQNEVTQLKSDLEAAKTVQSASSDKLQLQTHILKVENDYKAVDWATLEADEPAKAVLLRQKFNDSYSQLQNGMSQLEQLEQQQFQAHLKDANVELLKRVPSWNDDAVRADGMTAITTVLNDSGYNSEFINQLSDPIAISLLNELIELRAEKVNAGGIVKAVRTKPTMIKQKSRANAKAVNSKRLETAKTKAKTGSKHDQIDYIADLLS